MPRIEAISVSLPPDAAALVEEAVSSGDAIRASLRDWELRRADQLRDVGELRRLWEEGLRSGPGRCGSVQEMKAAAHQWHAAGQPAKMLARNGGLG